MSNTSQKQSIINNLQRYHLKTNATFFTKIKVLARLTSAIEDEQLSAKQKHFIERIITTLEKPKDLNTAELLQIIEHYLRSYLFFKSTTSNSNNNMLTASDTIFTDDDTKEEEDKFQKILEDIWKNIRNELQHELDNHAAETQNTSGFNP
ncbi:MAG: hypothetical protein Tsb005_18090 [Gammaproteobacteria bacterium]